MVKGNAQVRPLLETDLNWTVALTTQFFGSSVIVSRGVAHDVRVLPGLIADLAGSRAGLLLYNLEGNSCQIIVLMTVEPRQGIGLLLLERMQALAQGFERLWLVTTNDNVPAQRLFFKAGWILAAIHTAAVEHSRQLKPEIPQNGWEGIPIRDEWEFEFPP